MRATIEIDIDIGDYDNREDLMDDCLLSIEKEER